MNKWLPYLFLALAVVLTQCAQQTPLSGGERDKTPPQIDSTKQVIPANGSINFSAERIVIPFNEYVKLKDKDKQILITPFLETSPDIYVKGKKVIIDFNAPLENNTTYIVNFGKSIVDLTEGNEMVNYKYVFSTGSFIDSLSYTGVVYDAFTKSPVQGAYVMLYRNHEDSVLLKSKPNYFGITGGSGTCKIENIASGNYKVVAYMEENGNYLWETKSEMIGFTKKRFDAANDTLADTLVVFSDQPKELKIEEASVATNGKGWVAFNQPLDKNFDPTSDSLVSTFSLPNSARINPTRDTLFFYLEPSLKLGQKHTIGIQSGPSRKVAVPSNVDSSLTFKTNVSRGLKPEENLQFVFSQPISKTDFSKVQLKWGDSLLPFELVQTAVNQISIEAEWKSDENYGVTLFPGSVTSYRSISNDTLGAFFETLEDNDFGQLLTNVKTLEGNYIIHLLKDGKVHTTDYPVGNEFSRTYHQLTPGSYSLRIIFDENGNGVWDTGDYFMHQQPERVEYYSEPIQIKKGWDMEINWEILR